MSRQAVLENLRKLADSIEALAEEDKPTEKAAPKAKKEKKISFEEVRSVLGELTRDGKQKEVKQLITSYGAKKLSDVPEEKYQELLDKVGEL